MTAPPPTPVPSVIMIQLRNLLTFSFHHAPASASAQAQTPWTDGEVRKIDTGAGKLTLRHGPIQNLDMPPMTMVFNVRDKAVLDQFKAGDKVRFRAVNDAGKFTVTTIERAH